MHTKRIVLLSCCILFYYIIYAQQPRLVIPLVHSHEVFSARFSPDGKKFVTCSRDMTAKLWDVSTSKLLVNFVGHTNSVISASFSPDGKKILTTSEDNTAKIWEAASGKMIMDIETGPDRKMPVFSPDGKQLIAIVFDDAEGAYVCKLYDTDNSEILFSFKEKYDNVENVVYSNNNKKITCILQSGKIYTWSALTGELTDSLKIFELNSNARYFSPDGKKFFIISNDGKTMVWDFAEGKLICILDTNETEVNSAIFSLDNSKLVTFKNNDHPKIWNALTGKLINSVDEKIENASIAIFSPDGKKLMINAHEPVIRLWDVTSGKLSLVTTPADSTSSYLPEIKTAFFSSDGEKILTINSGGGTEIRNALTGKSMCIIENTTLIGWVNSAEFSPDGTRVLFAHNEMDFLLYTATIMDVSTGNTLSNLKAHTYMADAITLSPDGNQLISIHSRPDFNAKAWDLLTGKNLYRLEHKDFQEDGANMGPAVFSPKGKMIVTSASDRTTKLWDASTGRFISFIGKDEKYDYRSGNYIPSISSFVFSPDEKNIAYTIINDSTARIIDAASGKSLTSMKGDLRYNLKIRFTPDGKKLMNGFNSLDKFKIWDAVNGEYVSDIADNTIDYSTPIFSSDGKIAAYYNSNNKGFIKIWNGNSGKLELEIKNKPWQNHHASIFKVAFSPDGKKLLGIREDSSCSVWNAQTGVLIKRLTGFTAGISDAAFSNEGNKLVVLTNNNIAEIRDVYTGNLLTSTKDNGNAIPSNERVTFRHVWFSADDKMILTTDHDPGRGNYLFNNKRGDHYSTSTWDAVSGKLLADFTWTKTNFYYLDYSSDSKKIATALNDHTIKIWDTRSGKCLFTFFALDSIDYINMVDGGFYKSTPGAAKLLHYVTPDLKIISFEQLDVKYNRPDKVLQALGNTDSVMIRSYYNAYVKRIKKLGIDTTAFKDDYNMPDAEIVNRNEIAVVQENEKLQIHINASDGKYLLDRFNCWINEVPLFGMKGVRMTNQKKYKFDTTFTVILSEGENRIETSVTNVNGIESYRKPLVVKYTQGKATNVYNPIIKQDTTRIYFIGVGINEFADSNHNLKWCVQDIRDLTKVMREKYGSRLIIVDTLYNEQATRTNIRKLKRKLFSTGVNDKVIFSYSGHGLLSKSYDYFLSSYTVNFKDPEQGGIPYDEIENMLDSIPARKKLLLLDACNSGEVDKDEMNKIQTASEDLAKKNTTMINSNRGVIVTSNANAAVVGLQNSFELMQTMFVNVGKGTGAVIIAASAGVQFAQESSDLGHGVFTYSLIEAMKNNPTMKVSDLKKYIGNRVIQLTNGLQKPTTRNEMIAVDWEVW